MPFDWTDYLELARDLAGTSPGSALQEARLRAAISRGYYAAFKMAFNYLSGRNPAIRFQREAAHQYVYERFAYSPDVAWRGIGRTLDRLRRLRNRADYDDQFDRLPSETQRALDYATDIIAALSKLP